jgi:hypothetical protein
MVAPATPYYLPAEVQDNLVKFCQSTQLQSFNPQNVDLRTRFQNIDVEYIRENNLEDQSAQSVAANKMGNKRKIADIVIPLVEPQVQTALSYLSAVFLTGIPIFGVVADPANMGAAKQMEAVISENSITGGWARELLLFFLDGLKYNFHSVEVDWCTRKTYSLQTNAKNTKGQGELKEVIWSGNRIRRLDPYNTIFDPRVKITEQHKYAEFTGYVELYNRVGLAEFLASLPFRMNVTKAYESTLGMAAGLGQLYFIPNVFTENLSGAIRMLGVVNWDAWATGGKINVKTQYKNLYQVITRYVRIVPRDFKMMVPANGNVQIWKLITVNDAVLVYAERLSNAHNYLPTVFGQPTEDGLNLQTKSFAQKQIPLQDIASALANSRLAARRRAVSDRGLYDPSRIDPKYMNVDSPTAKIPVRPNAYGQPLEKAYYQMPFKYDEGNASVMSDVREVMKYGDYLSGQNPAQQGQFVKGNKTRSEFEDVQSKSSGRQQLMALALEHQVMAPIKEMIKLNVLQYQQAGPVYSYVEKTPINVNPVELRNSAIMFKVSDGLDPADKIMDGDTLATAMQVVAQPGSPIAQEYSAGGIFAQLMAIRGVDLTQYKLTPQQIQDRNQQEVALEQAKRTPPQQQGQPNGAPIQ